MLCGQRVSLSVTGAVPVVRGAAELAYHAWRAANHACGPLRNRNALQNQDSVICYCQVPSDTSGITQFCVNGKKDGTASTSYDVSGRGASVAQWPAVIDNGPQFCDTTISNKKCK